MGKEIVRVTRVIEYEGDREWLERTLSKSITGELRITPERTIRELSRTDLPPLSEDTPKPKRASEDFFVEIDRINGEFDA